MPRDNQGRPPSHKEERVEHHTKRNIERDPSETLVNVIHDGGNISRSLML